MPLPDKIANRPQLIPGLELYWRAYADMTSDREVGMGVGPIPWTAMHLWAVRHNIRGDDFDRLVLVLRGMDAVFMAHQAKKQKKGSKSKRSFAKAKALGSK